ncbi:MAG: DUF11 domain-containing protein, partial [Chloroflexi bacterium]|nr:DUF11 domain-containing protein [Chloroflexota bacterium]
VRSYLRVGVGITGNWLDIATAPGLEIAATLWSAGYGELKDTQYRTANDDGRAWLGFNVDVVPGDIVEVEADGRFVSLDVVDLSASGDAGTDTVSGIAPPDSYVEAEVWGHGDGSRKDTTSDGTGNWSIYFGDEFDVQPGDRGRAWWTHDDGHWFQVDFAMPYVEVHFRNYDWVQGRVAPNAWVEITLKDSLGEVKGGYSDWASGDGWFGGWCVLNEYGNCVDIAPGDTVEVVYDGGDPIIVPVIEITGVVDSTANTITGQILVEGESPISVPVITMNGQVDADTNTVFGNIPDVPINSTVRVEVWESDGPPAQETLTDEFGNYFVDFSPFDLQSGHMVAIWYVNPDGNQVGIVRHALRFADVNTATDSVAGNTWANVPVTVTVNGGETVATTSDEGGYFDTEFATDIGVGDVVEAWAGTSTQYASLTVEELSAWVDDPGDYVWGYGPPETYVQVEVNGDWRDTWTDDTGYYEVQYDWDIGPWHQIRAKYYHEGHSVMFGFGPSDVGVDKWARPWNVVPGDEFSFFIRYWNSSNAPASDVVITDTLPDYVTYQWDSSGITPTIDPETNTLVWDLGTLAAQRQRTFELRVRMDEDAPLGDDFKNQVEISDPQDSDHRNNRDEERVHTREPYVDVGIYKWLDAGRAFAGAELTYVLGYENTGNRTAHGVVITDTLPTHASFLETTFEVGVDGISEWVDEASGLVVWEIGTLAPGEWQDFELTVRVLDGTPPGTLLVNRAEISTSDDDTWSGNDWDTDTQVVEPYLPDLWVEKWVESDVSSLDDDITYRIEYHNDGPANAHNVVLTDTLPLSMTHVSHSAWATATVAGDQVIWELGTVAAGHGGYLYLTTHVVQPVAVGTVFTNTVDISTTDAETDYLNNHYVDVLGPPRVICVPWVGTHPHRIWSGLTTTLKGTAKGYGLTTYEWDAGDGSPVYSGAVGDPYVIEESHAYGAPVGTIYTATLTVWGAFGWSDTDTYTVQVFNPTHGVEVDVAIDEGLWYIHKEANRYSSGGLPFAEWQTSGYGVAETASAIQAFQVQGHRPGGDPWEDPYVEDVQRGWNALFTYARLDAMTLQPAGDPDGDGDGVGIGIYRHSGSSIYESGLAMMALVTTGSPGRVAHTGPPVYVRGQTYHSITQDMADWFAWGQNDDWSGWARGGWRYRPNSGDSDNSNTQFPVLGLAAAEHTWGITVPPWVKDELRDYWLAYTQNPSSGGFGYMDPDGWVNVGKTGAGIMNLAWTGVPISDTRVISAAQFIETHWYDTPDGNWNGNVGEMYSMYAVKKGSQLANIQWYGPHNWNYEYSSWLVGVQWPDGHFDDAGNFGGWQPMATSWAVMILSPGLYRPLPVPVIAPIHYGGIGAEWGDGEVLFDASDSHHTDPDREIVLYEWDFGDGSPVETTPGPITTHTYLARGAYPATLTVWDDAGASATAATLVNITAPDYPPVADPDGPYVAYVDRPLTLNGSGSYDPDEWMGDAIAEYLWDFGDGDVVSTTLPIVEHDWAAEGLYTVTLQVRDRGPEYGLDSPQWSTPVETTVTVSK